MSKICRMCGEESAKPWRCTECGKDLTQQHATTATEAEQ